MSVYEQFKQEASRIKQAKADLKTSLENKGVVIPSDATIDEYPALVESLEVGTSGEPIETTTMPVATAELIGKVYKYTGETTAEYENGALYIVEEEV